MYVALNTALAHALALALILAFFHLHHPIRPVKPANRTRTRTSTAATTTTTIALQQPRRPLLRLVHRRLQLQGAVGEGDRLRVALRPEAHGHVAAAERSLPGAQRLASAAAAAGRAVVQKTKRGGGDGEIRKEEKKDPVLSHHSEFPRERRAKWAGRQAREYGPDGRAICILRKGVDDG